MRLGRLEISVQDTARFEEFVERVEDFISAYAWHGRSCAAVDYDGNWNVGNPACTCGYEEDLANLIPWR